MIAYKTESSGEGFVFLFVDRGFNSEKEVVFLMEIFNRGFVYGKGFVFDEDFQQSVYLCKR